jgi:hypothetical protein
MQSVGVLGSEANKKEVQFCRRLPRRTPKIHMEAEEALGKLKRCPSLADLTAFLGTTVGPSFVGTTHRRNYLHAVIHRLPNSKFQSSKGANLSLPYDFIASCHWLWGRNER